ncbi:MAG TPA: hypothetical protein VNU68_26455 [Verrucomicrobiae bacterium]|nr:hypothetical protein [Verrucomicrobiae bacterium]
MKQHISSSALVAFALLLSSSQGPAQTVYTPYTFATLAGYVYSGGDDGFGLNARFYLPAGVALDGEGILYVADSSNHTIRKVTPAGDVTTLAGLAGSPGTSDGVGSGARFRNPSGVVVDSSGNVFVTDMSNYSIRKVTPWGEVTTVAGLPGQPGSDDGFGSNARFDLPNGLAIDSGGILYVTDTRKSTVRRVTQAGEVSTLAGLAGSVGSADGQGSEARFNYPEFLVPDTAGNLYVADYGNHAIRKVTPDGLVTTLAGAAESAGSTDGPAGTARFQSPFGVAIDSAGNLYVADTGNSTIRKITPTGIVTTLAGAASAGNQGALGSATDGTGSGARFRFLEGIAVDAQGTLYVSDWINNTVVKGKPAAYTPCAFTTLAGDSGYGSADAMGRSARFNGPFGVTIDTLGNLYVSDENNYLIRKITPEGMVTTLAGMAGVFGNADGTGNGARFGGCGESFFGFPPWCSGPQGMAMDSAGNVYVADPWNAIIRKITPDGIVTTLAGSPGNPGAADGTGSDAQFNGPSGLAADSAGNLYVAEPYSHTIRRVTPEGVVSTLAGLAYNPGSAEGVGSNARFNQPTGVAVDGNGNVYVADAGNHVIRRITPSGTVTTRAGSAGQRGSADGVRSAARFGSPSAIALDQAGNLYVADTGNETIRRVTPAGEVTTVAGSVGKYGAADGTGNAARFSSPKGITVDQAGNLYVADYWNNAIRKISPAAEVSTLAGFSSGSYGSWDGTGRDALFANPSGVAVDSAGNAYVADTENHTIRKITPAGAVTTLAGQTGQSGYADGKVSVAQFSSPSAVAVDAAGNVYVADTDNHAIRKITPTGDVSTLAGGEGGSADGQGAAAQFDYPYGVAVDDVGTVYVADTYNNTVRKVTPDGQVTTLAGMAGSGGSDDGLGRAARFSSPAGVAVDHSGNLYVADVDYAIIRKVTPDGTVRTIAGCAACPYGSFDGIGGEARFTAPWGIAVDNVGNVIVGDYGDHTIRQISPAGVVTTVGGLAGAVGSEDGLGYAARFGTCWYGGFGFGRRCLGPRGVAVDSAGNIYVADNHNNTIRKGYPANSPPRILTSGPGFGIAGGHFGFIVSGPPRQPIIIEASTDLMSWLPIWTNRFPGDSTFADLQAAAFPTRFYRVRAP